MKRLSLLLLLLGAMQMLHADETFTPSSEPVLKLNSPKPAIALALDNSGSMGIRDMILNGKTTSRIDALQHTVRLLFDRYKDKALLGYTNMNSRRNSWTLLDNHLPVQDLSKVDSNEYRRIYQNIDKDIIAFGNTPVSHVTYQAIRLLRGDPIILDQTDPPIISSHFESPLHYRCQSNHVILMTDGAANESFFYDILPGDKHLLKPYDARFNHNRHLLFRGEEHKFVVDIAQKIDLRDIRKLTIQHNTWADKLYDNAGQPWNDRYSKPMPITIHTVSLAMPIHDKMYKYYTDGTGGLRMGVEGGRNVMKNADDLISAFDVIFSTLVRSTSSTYASLDKEITTLPQSVPNISNLNNMGGIRYDSTYTFNEGIGSIRAVTSYKVADPSGDRSKDRINNVTLWETGSTILPNQGRYITFNPTSKKEMDLTTANIKKLYPQTPFRQAHEDWLRFNKSSKDAYFIQLNGRITPIGSSPNADLFLANHDNLYLNLELMQAYKQGFIQYLKNKASHFSSVIVLGDDTGTLRFINATRGLKSGRRAGEQNTAYFPSFLHERIDEIAHSHTHQLVIDGKTNISDGLVMKEGSDYYATVGLSSLGAGGKAVIGYQLYGKKAADLDNLKITGDTHITPLFEIVNEGKKRTPGFQNLGYSYSGFQFFNHMSPKSARTSPQLVALFGNGFGSASNVSSLYLIDAYTGDLIKEVILNKQGGGAATPTIIVKDAGLNMQQLDKVYVGDYEGHLYKVTFDAELNTESIQTLFKAPKTAKGQSAISVQPLVIRDPNKNDIHWVYFGTGLNASMELDRGKNSLVTHNLIAIKDIPAAMSSPLQLKDLNRGDLKYIGKKPYLDDYLTYKTYPVEADLQESHSQRGWYLPLTADGNNMGERLVYSPQYDNERKTIHFNTWGVYEFSIHQHEIYGKYRSDDPCLPSAIPFGKRLALDPFTGKTKHFSRESNLGYTNAAGGNFSGNYLSTGTEKAYGNQTTILSLGIQAELIEITGSADSYYSYDKASEDAGRCQTMVNGEILCLLDPFAQAGGGDFVGRLYMKRRPHH